MSDAGNCADRVGIASMAPRDAGAAGEDAPPGGVMAIARVEFKSERIPGMQLCSPSNETKKIPKCESLTMVFTPFYRT
jgi:hypothetical protein